MPSIRGKNIVDGSLFFKDFHKGEIPSLAQLQKLQLTTRRFRKVANTRFAVKGEVDAIRGELGAYVKGAEADARYLKVSDSVIRGDGSVYSGSRLIPPFAGKRPAVIEVPELLAIEAENGKPRLFYVVNRTGGALTHTGCGGGTFGAFPGVLPPGKFFHCPLYEEPVSVQLVGDGPEPTVATLTVSAVPDGQSQDARYTAQILIGT